MCMLFEELVKKWRPQPIPAPSSGERLQGLGRSSSTISAHISAFLVVDLSLLGHKSELITKASFFFSS